MARTPLNLFSVLLLLFKISFLFLLEIFIYTKDIWKFRVGKACESDWYKQIFDECLFSHRFETLNIFIVACSNMSGNSVGTLHFVVYFCVI